MAESYGGGFAGDRAGIMNLENVLGNTANMAMQNRLFAQNAAQAQFQREMSQKQYGLAQRQFGLTSRLAPFEAAAQLLPFYGDSNARMAMLQNLIPWLEGGKAGTKPMAGDSSPFGMMGGGININATANQPKDSTPGANLNWPGKMFVQHPFIMSGLGALGGGGVGGFLGGPVGAGIGGLLGAAIPGGLYAAYRDYDPTAPLPTDPNFVNPMPTPTPMMSALFSSTNAKNVNKRNSRAAGVAAPINNVPTAQPEPSPY